MSSIHSLSGRHAFFPFVIPKANDLTFRRLDLLLRDYAANAAN